ncbi:2OG-Fe(II) oxygenase family protein [Phenylobacterium sp. VNQ135]|uniref:2OG-Fe(II) oxygenase family protein n=1 Tax=Phenylobacterium sp. VNQ135 TaxID=3400922 RepID=UPI003C067911
MSLPPIRIREGLAPDRFADMYRDAGIVQATDFLESAAAQAIGDLLSGLPYAIVAPDETGQTLVINDEVLRRFGEQQVRAFLAETIKRASKGFAFIHRSYALQDEYGRAPNQPIAKVTEFLQSRAFLDFAAGIVGEPVDAVRVQASHYRRGDFLTLHDDSHSNDDRIAAFTLGFTRGWRPDWGGQLLFHDEAGDVVGGFAPRFNVLTVFQVPRAHSVAPVAAYAEAPRLSLTGWFIRERRA